MFMFISFENNNIKNYNLKAIIEYSHADDQDDYINEFLGLALALSYKPSMWGDLGIGSFCT